MIFWFCICKHNDCWCETAWSNIATVKSHSFMINLWFTYIKPWSVTFMTSWTLFPGHSHCSDWTQHYREQQLQYVNCYTFTWSWNFPPIAKITEWGNVHVAVLLLGLRYCPVFEYLPYALMKAFPPLIFCNNIDQNLDIGQGLRMRYTIWDLI